MLNVCRLRAHQARTTVEGPHLTLTTRDITITVTIARSQL
jgi:hypothetical protein